MTDYRTKDFSIGVVIYSIFERYIDSIVFPFAYANVMQIASSWAVGIAYVYKRELVIKSKINWLTSNPQIYERNMS